MTNTCFCAECAKARGLKAGIDTSDLLGTTYQQEKHQKHTVNPPSTSIPIQSQFDSSSTEYYADCINEAVEKGFVEFDNMSRMNIGYCPSTGSDFGTLYRWGKEASRPDTVVVVNTSAATAIHPLLKNSSSYSGKHCNDCHGDIL